MKTISLKNLFENQIENIWNNPKYNELEIRKFGYAQQDNQEINSLLFIGINPSNSKRDIQRFFYQNGNEGTHKYFKKFIEISNLTNLPWSHIDLLFVRETNQSFIKSLLFSKNKIILDFFIEQLELSKQMIETINPSIIIVNNTLARSLLGFNGDWLNLKFKFDDNFGTFTVDSKNSVLYGKPIFFTSMLTGQRALDIGSYQRLIWHINYVKSKMKENNTN